MVNFEQNIALNAERWFADGKDNTLLRSTNKENQLLDISYAQVRKAVLAWADYLHSQGVQEGDRVAMISPKCRYHHVFFYACWHLGVIAVPICESLGEAEMGFIIQDAEPKLVLADGAFEKKATACAGDIPVVLLDTLPAPEDATAPDNPPKATAFSSDAIAVLIYTSGSTGMPKGVMLSHKALMVNAQGALDLFSVSQKDCLISLLPYWHAYALTCEVLCIVMVGATCAVPKDIRDFRKNLVNYQPTIMIAVPRIVEMLKLAIDKQIASLPPKRKALVERAIYNASRIFTASARFNGGLLRILMHHIFYNPLVFKKFRAALGNKLRFIVCGGAPMDLELQVFFKFIGIPCLVGYGLTETSPIVSANTMQVHKLDSCGQLFPWLKPENGGDFTFKDEEGNLGKDLHGQLLVKGDCVMKGYWRHTDASAKTFENGWLDTGDMGYFDKDGFLHIAGRKGNMIVTIGGEKLHPEFVEDAIRLSPFISEVMVIGEKCKNIYALVNINKEEAEGMTPEQIQEKAHQVVLDCTKGLAALQKPKACLVLPDFTQEDGTLTATLKIRRFKIREKYKEQIEQFLVANGEEIATRHEVGIAHSRIQESL